MQDAELHRSSAGDPVRRCYDGFRECSAEAGSLPQMVIPKSLQLLQCNLKSTALQDRSPEKGDDVTNRRVHHPRKRDELVNETREKTNIRKV